MASTGIETIGMIEPINVEKTYVSISYHFYQYADSTLSEKKSLYDTYGREFNLPDFTMNDILEAIPAECFNRSAVKGLGYVARDLVLIGLIGLTAHHTIPLLPSPTLRFVAWMVYGLVQGLVGTGVWVLAHECGHQAFSPYRTLNDFVGWALHSALLVPYFSWQITHGKHHKATGHLAKDMVFVPKTRSTIIKRRGGNPADFPEEMTEEQENKLYDLIEDAPIASLYTLIIQQSLGWLGYLAFNLSGQPIQIEVSLKSIISILLLPCFQNTSTIKSFFPISVSLLRFLH